MVSRINIVSAILMSSALSFAIFFQGGTTQVLQLGVVTLLLIGGVCRAWLAIGAGSISWSRLHTALSLYCLVLILDIYTSVFPENSLQIAWLFLCLPMTVLLVGRLEDRHWGRLVSFLIIPILVSAFWGYGEFFNVSDRASGPVIDPNSWASGLNLCFFLLLSVFYRETGPRAYVSLAGAVVVCIASFMAYSRVGNVVFFTGTLVVLLLSMRRFELRHRSLVILIVVSVCFAAVHSYRSSEQATHHNEGYTLNIEATGWSQRLVQWQSALDQYQDYPVTGSGLGTFKVLYPQYRSLGDSKTSGNYVHNDYLQLLAEGGPLMLLFVISLLGFLGYQFIRASLGFIKSGEKKQFEASILIVAIGAVFVHAVMNFTLYNLVNQLLIGCVLGRLLWLLGFIKPLNFNLHSPKLIKGLVVLISLYILSINTMDAVSSDLVYKGGVLPIDRSAPGSDLEVYDIISTISHFRPNNSANRFAMATFYRTSFDSQPESNIEARRSLGIVAALEYQRGIELNPFNGQVRGFFVAFLQQNPWLLAQPEIYQTPEKLVRDGLALGPCYVRDYLRLVYVLESEQRFDEAYEVMTQQALYWEQLRYNDYEQYRIELFKKILEYAKERKDLSTLERLLKSMA